MASRLPRYRSNRTAMMGTQTSGSSKTILTWRSISSQIRALEEIFCDGSDCRPRRSQFSASSRRPRRAASSARSP